jgi:glycosyltransferase involved in cell wall biosynthesis
MTPLVSIIMPAFNAELTISETVFSVLCQDYSNFELIIINDHSVDRTPFLLDYFKNSDSRVSVFENKRNQGVANARNIGIENARGRFICFLDADDIMLQGSLRKRIQFSLKNNYPVVFGSYMRLLPNGKLKSVKTQFKVSFSDMLKRNHIGNLTGMYDSKLIECKFQKNIRHEDYLMWCELIKVAKFAYSIGPEPIGIYRVSCKSLSGNKIKSAIWHWNVLRYHLNVSFFSLIYFQICYIFHSVFSRLISRF